MNEMKTEDKHLASTFKLWTQITALAVATAFMWGQVAWADGTVFRSLRGLALSERKSPRNKHRGITRRKFVKEATAAVALIAAMPAIAATQNTVQAADSPKGASEKLPSVLPANPAPVINADDIKISVTATEAGHSEYSGAVDFNKIAREAVGNLFKKELPRNEVYQYAREKSFLLVNLNNISTTQREHLLKNGLNISIGIDPNLRAKGDKFDEKKEEGYYITIRINNREPFVYLLYATDVISKERYKNLLVATVHSAISTHLRTFDRKQRGDKDVKIVVEKNYEQGVFHLSDFDFVEAANAALWVATNQQFADASVPSDIGPGGDFKPDSYYMTDERYSELQARGLCIAIDRFEYRGNIREMGRAKWHLHFRVRVLDDSHGLACHFIYWPDRDGSMSRDMFRDNTIRYFTGAILEYVGKLDKVDQIKPYHGLIRRSRDIMVYAGAVLLSLKEYGGDVIRAYRTAVGKQKAAPPATKRPSLLERLRNSTRAAWIGLSGSAALLVFAAYRLSYSYAVPREWGPISTFINNYLNDALLIPGYTAAYYIAMYIVVSISRYLFGKVLPAPTVQKVDRFVEKLARVLIGVLGTIPQLHEGIRQEIGQLFGFEMGWGTWGDINTYLITGALSLAATQVFSFAPIADKSAKKAEAKKISASAAATDKTKLKTEARKRAKRRRRHRRGIIAIPVVRIGVKTRGTGLGNIAEQHIQLQGETKRLSELTFSAI